MKVREGLLTGQPTEGTQRENWGQICIKYIVYRYETVKE